tara:strand:+ start:737 stop:1177 length:441 start_codon:yes stop_codon:yes gene_type:complete
MALVGDLTIYNTVNSETETVKQTVTYPLAEAMGLNHPDVVNAGKTIEIEVPKLEIEETYFNNVYIVVHSVNSFKNPLYEGSPRNQMNICYRVYESREKAIADPFDFIYEDHLIKKEVDVSDLKINITQQAYKYLSQVAGFQNLIQD